MLANQRLSLSCPRPLIQVPVAMKVVQGLHNGVTTRELDQLAAEICEEICVVDSECVTCALHPSLFPRAYCAQAPTRQPTTLTGAFWQHALPSPIFTKKQSRAFRRTAPSSTLTVTPRRVSVQLFSAGICASLALHSPAVRSDLSLSFLGPISRYPLLLL
jgi:hypothetical protein